MSMNASRMAAIVLVVLLLAYPLSTGPVVRWQLGNKPGDFRIVPPALVAFYEPLRWFCQFEPFRSVMRSYEEMWYPQWFREGYSTRPAR